MKVIQNPTTLQKILLKYYKANKTIGFVPTMGALHKGHLSLIKKARKENDIVVVSIFVNPIQFAPNEDLKKYPRPWPKDKKLCKELNVDFLFHPDEKTFYADPYYTYIEVEKITKILCGKSRPTHFKGVTTVVNKLFNIVHPTTAYFGQKDFQQSVVIKKMVKDLNMPIKIKTLPIVREKDGLALSSRNKYLSKEERKRALALFNTLKYGKELFKNKEKRVSVLLSKMKSYFSKNIDLKNDKLDYIEIRDVNTLEEIKIIKKKSIIAIAAYIGKTRLIDNIIIG